MAFVNLFRYCSSHFPDTRLRTRIHKDWNCKSAQLQVVYKGAQASEKLFVKRCTRRVQASVQEVPRLVIQDICKEYPDLL